MLRRALLAETLAGALLLLVAGAAGAHTSGPMLSPPAPAAAVAATPAPPAALGAAATSADGALWPWLAPLLLAPVPL